MKSDFDRDGIDGPLATICFAAATAIGLVAAFVGLDASSFWLDELYTAWVVHPDNGLVGLVDRLVRDISPPLYYVLLYPVVLLFGSSEGSLRILSAACASAAIVLFVVRGRRYFSLSAVLFGAVLATGSFFWFLQAQNARHYALALLAGVAILLGSLSTLESEGRDRRKGLLAGLAAAMFFGTFVHFYVLFECLAVIAVLWLYCPGRRIALTGLALSLLASAWLYVKLVVERFSHNAFDKNWIGSDAAWYVTQLKTAFAFSFTSKALLALAICVGLAVTVHLRSGNRGSAKLSARLALVAGVPVLVAIGGIVSSIVMAPSFTDRNFLVCSPFLWALTATLYDRAFVSAPIVPRRIARAALAAIALWMSVSMAAGRWQAWNEPFRQSAEWILAQPSCRGQDLLVVATERREWLRSTNLERVYAFAYGWYLDGSATPRVVFLEDIRAGTVPRQLLDGIGRRATGEGCPVLAWALHRIDRGTMEDVGRDLLRAAGATVPPSFVMQNKVFRDGHEGYVLLVARR